VINTFFYQQFTNTNQETNSSPQKPHIRLKQCNLHASSNIVRKQTERDHFIYYRGKNALTGQNKHRCLQNHDWSAYVKCQSEIRNGRIIKHKLQHRLTMNHMIVQMWRQTTITCISSIISLQLHWSFISAKITAALTAYQEHTSVVEAAQHLLSTPKWTRTHKLDLHLFRPTESARNVRLSTTCSKLALHKTTHNTQYCKHCSAFYYL